jgi:hypothetical protein
VLLSLAAVLGSVGSAGCHMAMRKAEVDVRTPPPGQALVIFVRKKSEQHDKMSNVSVALTDDHGHLVAALGTDEHVSIPVAPGPHQFIAFRGFGSKNKLMYDEEPSPIPTIFLEAAAGKVYYVAANLSSDGTKVDYIAKADLKHINDPYAPYRPSMLNPATQQLAALAAGSTIGQGIFGAFGGTRLVPFGLRFGNSEAACRDLVQTTEAREVVPENARSFDEDVQDQYWWSHGWQSGVENGKNYPPDVREGRTLHESDGFDASPKPAPASAAPVGSTLAADSAPVNSVTPASPPEQKDAKDPGAVPATAPR